MADPMAVFVDALVLKPRELVIIALTTIIMIFAHMLMKELLIMTLTVLIVTLTHTLMCSGRPQQRTVATMSPCTYRWMNQKPEFQCLREERAHGCWVVES